MRALALNDAMSKTTEEYWQKLARQSANGGIKNAREAAMFELMKALAAVIDDLQDLQKRVVKLEYDKASNPIQIASSPN